MTRAVELAQIASAGVSEAFKNRIINGGMTISQRGNQNIVPGGGYVYTAADRFSLVNYFNSGQINTSQSTTAPAGFSNSLQLTVSSAAPLNGNTGFYTALAQSIEGVNIGSCYNSVITLSFWVRSSVTGTYSVTFQNVSATGIGTGTRIYVANYTINAANTWEQKSITLDLSAGTAVGTWNQDNNVGLTVLFNLGAESNRKGNSYLNTWATWNASTPDLSSAAQVNWASNAGATFNITGVQVEVGSTATSFEYRPYSTELDLCQRYFQWNVRAIVFGRDSTSVVYNHVCPVQMRTVPTVSLTTTSPYWENLAWSSVGSLTGATVSNGHMTSIGGDILIAGTFAQNPTGGANSNFGGNQIAISAEL